MGLKQIDHGSAEYKKMVELRKEILRKPLGLDFSEADLENEKWVPTEEDLKKLEQILKIQDFVEPQQPLSEEFEPYISDDFQIGPDGAYEHTEDETETTNNLSFESQIVVEPEIVEEPEENPDVPKINRLTYTNRNE